MSGCCNKESSRANPPGFPPTSSQSYQETGESQKASTIESAEEIIPSSVRSFDERWEDFRSRLKFSQPTDLVFYAEGLFDEAPRDDRKRRMELAFFLLETYQKRGDRQKAREYSKEYENLLQATMGGVDFRKHNGEKMGGAWVGEKWKDGNAED